MALRQGYRALGLHSPAALDSATMAITTSTPIAAAMPLDPAMALGGMLDRREVS
jgi:hypothetical protein